MSNLIEQLGGYEKAKEVMDNIPKDGRSYTITRDDTGITFNTSELHKALLEYRRQHNIFDVGDKVVKTNPKIKFEFVREAKGVFKDGSVWLDYVGYKWKYPKVRHATDAEIEVGHRLPQLEVLDDIDIPPNTIILGDK